ncbi:MAG: hypothetical protein LBG29_07565, partial [Synergistaceae bacterium]|nr:hypothetical protein [Synergistaceae bacterium]
EVILLHAIYRLCALLSSPLLNFPGTFFPISISIYFYVVHPARLGHLTYARFDDKLLAVRTLQDRADGVLDNIAVKRKAIFSRVGKGLWWRPKQPPEGLRAV